MQTEPMVRAFISRALITKARNLPPEQSAQVLARIPDATQRKAEGLSRVDWLPLADHMVILEALREVLGVPAFRALHRAMSAEGVRSPLLEPLFSAAFALFGVRPDAMIKWAPKAWPLIFRIDATIEGTVSSPKEGRVVLDNFPRAHFQSGTFVEAYGSALEAYYTLTRHEGTVITTSVDPARGRAEYQLAWR